MKRVFYFLAAMLIFSSLTAQQLKTDHVSHACKASESFDPKANHGFKPLTEKEWNSFAEKATDLATLKIPKAKALPVSVDNSEQPYFLSFIISQCCCCCAQSSGIGYNLTYEMNRIKGTSANIPENQMSQHYTWNQLNYGTNEGTHYFDGWEIAQTNGCMTIADFGFGCPGYNYPEGDTKWATGYEKYYRAMHNRAGDYYYADATTTAGREALKNWFYNYNGTESVGGLANFSTGGHAMTLVGYDDSQQAFLAVNSFGGYGFFTVPYSSFGSTYLPRVYMMKGVDHTPLQTFKINMSHDTRNSLYFSVGVSRNINATEPDEILVYETFRTQGGPNPMQGIGASPSIEFGLDLTDLTEYVSINEDAVYFFNVHSVGPGSGTIQSVSLIDYTDQQKEYDGEQTNVSIISNQTNTIRIVKIKDLNKPVINVSFNNISGDNNGNGQIDPGETCNMNLNIKNIGAVSSGNATLTCTPVGSNAGNVSVNTNNINLGTIGSGSQISRSVNMTVNGTQNMFITLRFTVSDGVWVYQFTETFEVGSIDEYLMSSESVSTCFGKFYDAGGPNNNYADNLSQTMTFNPGIPGKKVHADFKALDIEADAACEYDYLTIYDGTSTSAPQIGTYCGYDNPGLVVATNSQGALTFSFTSDGLINNPGWEANILCDPYSDEPTKKLNWNGTTFVESYNNDGSSPTVILVNLVGETFAIPNGVMTEGIHFRTANVPAGLSVRVTKTGSTSASIRLIGNAVEHGNLDDVSNMVVTFQNAVFSGGVASDVFNFSQQLAIDYTEGPDLEAPSVPQNLVATDISYYSIDIAWDASTDNVGVDHYMVRYGSEVINVGNVLSYSAGGLTPETTYTFTVSAVDAVGHESDESAPLSVTTDVKPNCITTTLSLTLDGFPEETTWDIKGAGGNVLYSGGPYPSEAGVTKTESFCFPDGCYSFTIYDSYGDGLEDSPAGSYSLTDEQGNVLASGSGGDFEFSATTNFCFGSGDDTEPPTAPTNLASPAVASFTADLTWTASTDNVAVAYYTVKYGSTEINVGNVTSYTVTGLNPSTSYTFTVTASDPSENESAASNPLTITTDIPPSCINVTLTLELDAFPEETTWDITNASGTVIHSGGPYNNPADIGEIKTETFCLDKECFDFTIYDSYGDGLEDDPSGSYELKDEANNILASGSGGDFEYSATTNFCFESGDTEPPTVPTGLTASGITATGFQLSWNASSDNIGVANYVISRNGSQIGTSTSTILVVTGLTCETTSGFTVRAKDAVGNESAESTVLNVTTLDCPDTEPPTVPTGLVASNITKESFFLNWNPSADNVGVTGYDVFKDGALLGNSVTPGFDVTGLTCESTNWYTVRAKDAAGNTSSESTALSVTTAECIVLEAPRTSISSPANNAQFSIGDDITIEATAVDADGTVILVEFFQGSIKIGEDATAPYSITWSDVLAGNYVLTTVATDNDNLTATSSPVNISVADLYVPCTSVSESQSYEYITGVRIGSFTNTSGNDGGYADYSSQVINLTAGETVPVALVTNNTSDNEYWCIWIDYDMDGNFTTSERVFLGNGRGGTVNGNTVALQASSGDVRLRVSLMYNRAPEPCSNNRYGEVEDYTANIISNPQLPLVAKGEEIVNISPNPTEGMVRITTNKEGVYPITVINLLGKVVKSIKGEGSLTEVDLSDLVKGTYIINVDGSSKMLIKK